MPKYIIERDIPGVGDSPAAALQAVSCMIRVSRRRTELIRYAEHNLVFQPHFRVWAAMSERISRALHIRRLFRFDVKNRAMPKFSGSEFKPEQSEHLPRKIKF